MPEPTDLISMKIFKDSTNSGLGKWVQLPRGRWHPSSWHEVAPFSSLCLVNCICIWSFVNLHLILVWIAFDLFLPQAGEQLAGIRWLWLAQLHCSIVHQVSIIFDWLIWSVVFICSSGFQCGWCTSVRTSSRLYYEKWPKILCGWLSVEKC